MVSWENVFFLLLDIVILCDRNILLKALMGNIILRSFDIKSNLEKEALCSQGFVKSEDEIWLKGL